jgi:hypothetical protein
MKALRLLLSRAKRVDCLIRSNVANPSFKVTADEEIDGMSFFLCSSVSRCDGGSSSGDQVRACGMG